MYFVWKYLIKLLLLLYNNYEQFILLNFPRFLAPAEQMSRNSDKTGVTRIFLLLVKN